MNKIPNVTPGEILLEEFLIPLDISANKLAKDINIASASVSRIINGKKKIDADTALRFSYYFGNSPDFWLGIQDEYDLRIEKDKLRHELERIPKVKAS